MDHPGGSGDDGTGSGEDQEESSSSPSSTSVRVEDALASFRQQWHKELEESPMRVHTQSEDGQSDESTHEDKDDSLSIENKAKTLFLKGIEHEQSGQLYEAIQFYKRAVQLVPDIEFRLYESTKPKTRDRLENDDRIESVETLRDVDDTEDETIDDAGDNSLLVELSRIVIRNRCVCYPKFEQNTTHISALPMEIVLYILRWVVSSELDLRSLEMFSRVCRGFFTCARDQEIWRLACVRVWGVNCGNYEPKYSSWRGMYLQRPRLRYNGCYISKTTYIRHGENSFQDQFYRPWHLVEYYRYLRFFPDGRVLVLTSTEDAQSCVNALKHRLPRNPAVLIGHYRLHDDCVILVLKKQPVKSTNITSSRRKKREVVHDSGEQTYHIEFGIQNHHKRLNSQLSWLEYNIFTKYKNGRETTMCLSVTGRYPSCKFSRVKSYAQESEAPLQ